MPESIDTPPAGAMPLGFPIDPPLPGLIGASHRAMEASGSEDAGVAALGLPHALTGAAPAARSPGRCCRINLPFSGRGGEPLALPWVGTRVSMLKSCRFRSQSAHAPENRKYIARQ